MPLMLASAVVKPWKPRAWQCPEPGQCLQRTGPQYPTPSRASRLGHGGRGAPHPRLDPGSVCTTWADFFTLLCLVCGAHAILGLPTERQSQLCKIMSKV